MAKRDWWRLVPPHFLGRHTSFSNCHRRVYIDLGARQFGDWLHLLKEYPQLASFDEIYAFEMQTGLYSVPPPGELAQALHKAGVKDASAIALSLPRRIVFELARVAARSNASSTPPTVGFSDFLQRLRLTRDDAVVVKMDIEGFEYDVIASLFEKGTCAAAEPHGSRRGV